MAAHDPFHGSGQAGLPHPALTSGNNAHAAQGIRMTNANGRQPAVDQAPHPVPKHTGILTAARERTMPEPTYLEPTRVPRRAVGRHPVIPDVSTHDRSEPLTYFRDGVVHASFEFGFHLPQLRLQPFTSRLPQHRESSIAALLPTDVGRAEEVKCLRFPFSALLPVFGREPSELQQARFLGMQFQAELLHSLDQFCPEPFRVRFRLEAHHDVVSKPHDDHVPACLRSTPCLGPQVEHVVKINVYVDDQDRALRFYTGVLGFARKTDFSNGPYRWLTVASPEESDGTELQLALNNNPAAKAYQQAMFQQGQPGAMFFTDDVKGDYERIKARGAEFAMPPTDVTGSTIAMLKDTCGNLIQLTQLASWSR
jgi:predicted enzyme related to lactoylglutathione lyase